jgi:Na+/melibiose symporter-like transporter
MKKNIDELINDYVDGNLDSGEVEELNRSLLEDPSSVLKLKALKIVDSHLREIKLEAAPDTIVGKVISKLGGVLNKELPKSYFFQGIIGFFTLSMAGLIVYFFSYFSSADKEYSNSEIVINKINIFLTDLMAKLTGRLVNSDLMLIISIAALIVTLSFYFLYESNKSIKKRLHSTAR